MTPPTFEHTTYQVGTTRTGAAITLAPITSEAARTLGQACAAIDPWKHYAMTADSLTAAFMPASDATYRYQVRVGTDLAGVMMVQSPWLLGPYLRFIAVLPAQQGTSTGTALLRWLEARARLTKQRNIWLCVSAFNARARAVYQAQGWQEVTALPDLVSDGIDEILMRKRLP